MADSNVGIKTLILPGILAIFGTVVGGLTTGYLNVKLEEQKYQSQLVLKALESDSPKERLETLDMLVKTNLIKESGVKDGVEKYIDEKEKDPSSIPQIKTTPLQTLEPPVAKNTRLYLLSDKNFRKDFDSLRQVLTEAGFPILDTKYLIDPGRLMSLKSSILMWQMLYNLKRSRSLCGSNIITLLLKRDYPPAQILSPGI